MYCFINVLEEFWPRYEYIWMGFPMLFVPGTAFIFIVEFSFWSARIQLNVMQVFEVKQRCAVVS